MADERVVISTQVSQEVAESIQNLAELAEESRSVIIRAIIRAGLPVVAREYAERRKQDEPGE